jgi:hypothetical protein
MQQLDMFEKELRKVITNRVKQRISWEVKAWGYMSPARLYRRELGQRRELFRRYGLI